MNKRSFLKTVAAGAVSVATWDFPRILRAQTTSSYASILPTTPFDSPPGSWTLAVLPDTQNYAESFPAVYDRQCEWIVANQKKHNILFVAHEGDITESNNPPQWENARKSMSLLNSAGIPYTLIPGNHDTGPTGNRCADRSTLLNDYFSESDFKASSAYGLFEPGKLQNNWHHFDTPTGKFLIVGTEYCPRDAVVDWVKDIVAKNAGRKAILLTHYYLYSDSTRFDLRQSKKGQMNMNHWKSLAADGRANDGQDLWEKVVAPSNNVLLTLNGHVLNNGTGHLVSKANDGHPVHQILANYQAVVEIDDGAGGIPFGRQSGDYKPINRAFGGGGFLRLMQFQPDGMTVAVKTYSPWYDRWLTQADQQFTIALGQSTGVSA